MNKLSVVYLGVQPMTFSLFPWMFALQTKESARALGAKNVTSVMTEVKHAHADLFLRIQ